MTRIRLKPRDSAVTVLGSTIADPLAEILNTDVRRFVSPYGIEGQYWVAGNQLNLLTMIACAPGTGQCRRFIDVCKSEFDSVGVWEVWNDELGAALERWGFSHAQMQHAGETVSGYLWDKSVKGHSSSAIGRMVQGPNARRRKFQQ